MLLDNEAPLEFSIILPLHNGGQYAKECILSILQQNYKNFNLIILENSSTDDTVQWIDGLNDKRIFIHPSETLLSLEENWARIVSIPKNKFMTVIGHDDLLMPNYLEVMNRLIKKHPYASLYQTHFSYIDKSGKFLRHCLPMCEITRVDEFIAHQFMTTLDSTGTGYMMRSADFNFLGGFPQRQNLIFSDYELWVKLILKNYLAVDASECFCYREHNSASLVTQSNKYQESLFSYLRFIREEASSNAGIKNILFKYGPNYLNYMFTEIIYKSLKSKNRKDSKNFNLIIKEFESFAKYLMPNVEYSPKIPTHIRVIFLLKYLLVVRILFKLLVTAKFLGKNLINSYLK